MDPSFYPCNQRKLNQRQTKERFLDQVVIVTGGASGIGFAAAHRFCNDGAKVVILDKNADLATSSVEHLNAEGFVHSSSFHAIDVTERQKCDEVVASIAKDNGGFINHLVNGVVDFNSRGLNIQTDEWRKTFEVNVIGYSNMVQACVPYMKADAGCSVVHICSTGAHRPQPGRWNYSASKGAIASLTRCMALDLANFGIRVNSVSPAWVWSPEVAKVSPSGRREDLRETVSNFHMLRRDCDTSEVAAVITFLSSRDASFVTGSDVLVDGGYCAMGPEQHGQSSKFAGRDV